VIAELPHPIRTADGRVYRFAIVDHVEELTQAITVLDLFWEAGFVRAIGWDDTEMQHVLVDPELRDFDPDGSVEDLCVFLAAVLQTTPVT